MYVHSALFKVVLISFVDFSPIRRIKLKMVLPKNLSSEMLVHKPVLLLHIKDFSGRMCSSLFTCNWLADNVNLVLASTDGIAGTILSVHYQMIISPLFHLY
jgi:hypothetical protein